MPVLFEKTKIPKLVKPKKDCQNVSLKPFLGSGTPSNHSESCFLQMRNIGNSESSQGCSVCQHFTRVTMYIYPAWHEDEKMGEKCGYCVSCHVLEQNQIVTRQMLALFEIVLEQETDLLLKKKRMGEIQNIQNGSRREVSPFS